MTPAPFRALVIDPDAAAADRFPRADVPLGRRCVRWRHATVLAAIDALAGEDDR